MKNIVFLGKRLFLFTILFVLFSQNFPFAAAKIISKTHDKTQVIETVTNFGKQLKYVSKLAPYDGLKQSILDYYGTLVTERLMNEWQSRPEDVPGRAVSSPWPCYIEILSVEKKSDGVFLVSGNIAEMTSAEIGTGRAANLVPITLTLVKIKGHYLIDSVVTGKIPPAVYPSTTPETD